MEFIRPLLISAIFLLGKMFIFHVPAITLNRSSFRTPVATAHASISNIPPYTGVPVFSPVSAATLVVILPRISVARISGGILLNISGIPKKSNNRESYSRLVRFTKLFPEASPSSCLTSPVSKNPVKSLLDKTLPIF